MANLQPPFANRRAAGRELGKILASHKLVKPLVLGIAMGGVEVAAEVADRLSASLDLIVSRRLTLPGLPGLTFGATCSDGMLYLDPGLGEHVPMTYLMETIKDQSRRARELYHELRGDRLPLRLTGRTVILVDDGMLTGATMLSAIQCIQRRRPERLIVAVPVAPPAACRLIRGHVRLVLCPHLPAELKTCSAYYVDFAAVSEDRVKALLGVTT